MNGLPLNPELKSIILEFHHYLEIEWGLQGFSVTVLSKIRLNLKRLQGQDYHCL